MRGITEDLQKQVYELQDRIRELNAELDTVLSRLSAIQKRTNETGTWVDCDAEMKRIRQWLIRRGREK